MKNSLIIIVAVATVFGLISFTQSSAEDSVPAGYEYKIITAVESIVPMGLGRSRIIENTTSIDVNMATTVRTDGKKTEQGDVKRKDLKIDSFKETKMVNFYSAVGINFQNIASNDAMQTSKLNQLTSEGWDLVNIIGGVESDAGKEDGNGLFITRYYFKRAI